MAKLHEMEYFYGIEQFDRAFDDTAGQIKAMHLGLTPKKPDKSKVKDLLAKAASPGKPVPGKFFLVLEGLKLTFELRIGTTPKMVLNTLDIGAVKDIVKRRDLLFQLSERASELVTKAEVKKFDEEHTEPENPTVQKASVEIGNEIDDIEHEIDGLEITKNASNFKTRNTASGTKTFKSGWRRRVLFASLLLRTM